MEVVRAMNGYKKLLQENPVKFGVMSGFTDLGDIHNEWIKDFVFAKEDQTLLAHRWLI